MSVYMWRQAYPRRVLINLYQNCINVLLPERIELEECKCTRQDSTTIPRIDKTINSNRYHENHEANTSRTYRELVQS